MRTLIISLLCLSAWGGQSIVTTGSVYPRNLSVTNAGHSTPIRLEGQFHSWDTSFSGYWWIDHAHGSYASLAAGCSGTSSSGMTTNGCLQINDYWDTTGSAFNVPLPSTVKYINVRLQRDPVAMTQSIEAWDYLGNPLYQQQFSITDQADANDGVTGVGIATVDVGFFRVHNTLVPLGSRPPVTSDSAGTILHWKFDGDLTDSSGGGWNATMASGAASYTSTLYQSPPIAIIKVYGAPAYTNTPSIRVGVPNKLDCTGSYSQGDSSATCTCAWTASGPGAATLDNASVTQPNLTPAVFGDYTVGLTVTDSGANTASTSAHIGAVVADSNWVVQSADPNVEKILGKQIAYGHNPWGFADERAFKALGLQTAWWTTLGINPPSWKTPLTGTVSYRFGGETDLNGRGTTLSTAINSTDLTIVVASAAALDLSGLPGTPTRILLMPNYYSTAEEVRICSASGNTLTVCSGGRASYGTAQSWGVGTKVGQMKITGTGTSFLSTVCSGSHPTWQPSLHYTRSDGSDSQMIWVKTGCESDTALYITNGSHDVASLNNTSQSGVQYTYGAFSGYTNQYGPSFYGSDLAFWRLYFRSGLDAAKAAAKTMSEQWVTSPYVSGGDGFGQSPLLYGGAVIGAIAAKVLDSSTTLSWSDLKGFGTLALPNADVTGAGACDTSFDTRDNGYALGILSLLAVFDGDLTRRATWAAAVATNTNNTWTREQACKRDDNSWYNAGYKWSNTSLDTAGHATAPLTVTDGSTAVTGTGLTSFMCAGIASGSLTVTNGSANVTGTGFVSGNKIAITGLLGGSQFSAWYQFQFNSSTSIKLAALWPGDSGSATYVIENDDNLTAIGAAADDARLQKNWSCTFNSSTSLTLNRPWVKAGGGSETVYMYRSNLPGRSQQPYMLGIKAKQFRWAALSDTGHDWSGLAASLGAWLATSGIDSVTGGLFYGRFLEACEPPTTPPASPAFFYRQPGCNQGLLAAGVKASRSLTAEGMSGLIAWYLASPDSTRRAVVDQAYGSLWGYAAWTTSGYYVPPDGYYVTDETSDTSLGSYKWTGFFFGMGASDEWPAVRAASIVASTFNRAVGGKVSTGGKVQ